MDSKTIEDYKQLFMDLVTEDERRIEKESTIEALQAQQLKLQDQMTQNQVFV